MSGVLLLAVLAVSEPFRMTLTFDDSLKGRPLVSEMAGAAAERKDPAHALHFAVMRDTPVVDGAIGADEYPASHGVMFAIDTNFGDYEKNSSRADGFCRTSDGFHK